MGCAAIPARDTCTFGSFAPIGAVAAKVATATGMTRAVLKPCLTPYLALNVRIAGVPRCESKLHRPWPARLPPWRATSFRDDGNLASDYGPVSQCESR